MRLKALSQIIFKHIKAILFNLCNRTRNILWYIYHKNTELPQKKRKEEETISINSR